MGGYTLLGSLVGYLNSSSGNGNVSIKNCYTTGNIEVLNARNYGLLIGTLYTSVNGNVIDSIINCYSTVKPIKTTPIGITISAAKIIGEILNFNNNTILSIKIKVVLDYTMIYQLLIIILVKQIQVFLYRIQCLRVRLVVILVL